MVVDENGAVVDQPGITFRTKLSGADYERAMKDGWLYTLDVPVKKAGPYELRVAVRDNATGRIGTASQSVQAPDLQPERVALSGLMLQTLGTERAAGQDLRGSTARIFHPGETVTYSYQVLNPKLDKGTRRPKVEAQVNLYRDGKEPSTGRPVPMVVAADPTRLLASGALKIGLDMPAGEYVLEVVATDLLANVLGAEGYHNRTVAQYINFQVAP
jgi:hypothetical protein